MLNKTASAEMYPVRQCLVDQFTADASLAGVPWISFDNLATSFFPFVAKLQKEAVPSNIAYMFSQSVILNHSFDVKVFNSNNSIVVCYEPADFVVKVISLVENSFVQFGNFQPHLVPLDRAFGSFGLFPLEEFKPLLALDKVSRVRYACSCGESSKVLQPDINADFVIRIGMNKFSIRQPTAKHSKPFVSWSFFNGKCFSLSFRNSVQNDWQIANLADFDVLVADEIESRLRVSYAVIPVLASESWVACIRLCKELVKGFNESVVDILQHLRMNFFKFWVDYPQIKKHGVKVLIRKVYSFLLIPNNLVFKLLVVKQPAYLDMFIKKFLLLFIRVNPKLVHSVHGDYV